VDGVELRWPAAANTLRYRVSVRTSAGEPLFEADVSEPILRVPRSKLPAGERCEWRVWRRSSRRSRWETYLPELMIVDERLAAAPAVDWPEEPSALAYRLIVRDDHADAVVLKDGFLAAPGRLDFAQLDPSHLHRVRVQAWVDGAWKDHQPYKPALAPPEAIAGEVLELACPEDPEAVEYRFSVRALRGEMPPLDLELAQPTLHLPAVFLPPDVRCEWHVSVRHEPDGEWLPHLPEIVIEDEELAAQPRLSWPEAPGATAYRVVIRDDELGETVSKYGLRSTEGWVDWSVLDASHPHRVRIQAWIDRDWRDHVRYRVAFPPPEHLFRPVAPGKLSELEHLVVVHFPAHYMDAAYGVERPNALNVSRLRLFERLTLPSLRSLADQGVEWFMVPDAELSAPILASLAELCGERLVGTGDRPGPAIGEGGRGVAVVWLTAGDALHPGVPGAVERRLAADAAQRDEAFSVVFPLCVEVGPGGGRLARDPAPAAFAVIVEPPGRSVTPTNPHHPILSLRSLDAQVQDWSVPALIRARPGPNEHPIFLRERGPTVSADLLEQIGVEVDPDVPADDVSATA
jgi:Putative rhamnosyl transferase